MCRQHDLTSASGAAGFGISGSVNEIMKMGSSFLDLIFSPAERLYSKSDT